MPAGRGTGRSSASGASGMATDATTAVPTAASRYINARAITERSVTTRKAASSRAPRPRRCRRGDLKPNTSRYFGSAAEAPSWRKSSAAGRMFGWAEIFDRISNPYGAAADHIRVQTAPVHQAAQHAGLRELLQVAAGVAELGDD